MIRGITFDKKLMKSEDLAHQVNYFYQGQMGVTKGCDITENVDGDLVVSDGYFIIYGRLINNTGDTIIDVPAVASGTLYSILVFEIDLSQENTVDEFNQGSFKILSDASDYPTLTQEDLDNGGNIYQMEFCRFENAVAGISNLVDNRTILNLGMYALSGPFNSHVGEKASDDVHGLLSDGVFLEANKSFNTDIEAYYGNIKLVDDLQDESLWTAGSGTKSKDSTNVKIGEGSLRITEPDNTAGSLHAAKNNIALDLTKLNNGEDSGDDDYIFVVLYISNVDAINLTGSAIEISFGSDLTFDQNNRKKFKFDSGLVTGWNYIKIPKSSATTSGTGSWSDIQSLRLLWASNANYQDEYVSLQLIQLVKKDPIADYPNLFQKLGVRDLAINSGEWFVGEEFGQNIIKKIDDSSGDINALEGKDSFNDFIINYRVLANSNNDCDSPVWFIDNANYIAAIINNDNLKLRIVDGGVTTDKDVSFDFDIGDILNITLEKKGTSVNARVFTENNNLDEQLNATTALTDLGKFTVFSIANALSAILSTSITEISHAHHANVTEIAKGLTEQAKCKVAMLSDQSIPTDTVTTVVFEKTNIDNRNHWDSDEPSRIYIRESGYYDILAMVRFAVNASASRRIYIYINSCSEIINSCNPISTTYSTDITARLQDIYLKTGDYIEMKVYQKSGSALNIEYVDNTKDYTSLTVSKRP